jgi:hypothetical protein
MSPKRTTCFLTLALAGCSLAGCSGEISKQGGKADPSPSGASSGSDAPIPGGVDPVTGAPVPGGDPLPPGAQACAATALPRTRVWRLSHGQLKNTLADVFQYSGTAIDALPPDARLDGFGNRADRLGFSPLLMEHYFAVGDEVAADVIKRSGEFLGCPVATLGEGSCLGDFLRKIGRRAWRRPLEDVDIQALTGVYAAASKADGAEAGLKSVITALLLSPNFLFRTELGPATDKPGVATRLTDFELASSLAYMLWDAPPDEALLDLAVANKLHEPATLAAEARRMFNSSKRAPDAMNAFLRQWLKIEDLPTQTKDNTLFPFYTAGVGQDLLDETRLFFNDVVFEPGGDRSVKTLFTSTRGFASPRTAAIYGLAANTLDPRATGLAKVELDPKRRRGLLTSGGFLSAHAGGDATKVVDRGAFVREEFLCAEVPAPPQNFKFEDAAITDDMTAREKLLIHAKNPACGSCHHLFDGIGFALENYDAVGRFREMEKTKTIDPSGVLPLPEGGDITFTNFVDLMDQLAKKPDIYNCFATQYLSYATGRGIQEIDPCERTNLLAAFAQSGYRVDSLVVSLVTSPAFTTRKN